MFLDQDYKNSIQLIYNNSCVFQNLSEHLPPDRFLLVNNCIDHVTKGDYRTLGAIYRDAITYIPEDVDVIVFWDDDDLFLPDHISEGVKGLLKGGKTAYKPKLSYYKAGVEEKILVENTLEPSIFVKKEHILKYGFSQTTSDQHIAWVNPLVSDDEIFVDPQGKPTLIYTWGNPIGVFKTSGNPKNPTNFTEYERFSKDIGDRIITPVSRLEVQKEF